MVERFLFEVVPCVVPFRVLKDVQPHYYLGRVLRDLITNRGGELNFDNQFGTKMNFMFLFW